MKKKLLESMLKFFLCMWKNKDHPILIWPIKDRIRVIAISQIATCFSQSVLDPNPIDQPFTIFN